MADKLAFLKKLYNIYINIQSEEQYASARSA